MRALGVFVAALGLCALTACESEAPIRPVSVDVNLSPCLGAIDSAGIGDRDGSLQPVVSTCRDNLDVQVADATVNACFVVRQIAGGAAQRLPLQWSGGRLTEPFPDRNIELPPAERLEASLFFLATGDENGRVCDDFEVDTTCTGGPDCVLKLHQVEVTPLADGSTTFDFTEGGLCNAETGDAFGSSAVEVCDGMDNDCDRIVDEEIPGAGESCSDGIGACRSMGMTFCDPAAGMVVCGAMAGAPGDEAEPAVDCRDDLEACCDGVDDDCDGVNDEDIACSPCEADEDCAENIAGQECVGDRCRVCDPADVEHAGCAEDELCCESGGTPRCEPTSFGPDRSEQCEACGSPCVFVDEEQGNRRIANADNCGTRQCQCGFGPACGGASPFCVNGQCQECIENGDCAENELCCDGQCQPTGPDTQCEACGETCVAQIANRCVNRVCRCGEAERCVIDQATCTAGQDCDGDPDNPACSPRSFRCEDCAVDLDCQPDANPVAEPACVDRQCRECKDDDDRFCAGPSADDGRPECVISDCFECDRRNHDGCAEDSAEPFCDVDQNACRGCEDDAECQSRPGVLNQCEDGRCVVCDPETYEGCPDPDASICDPVTLTCRGCDTTDECNANNEPGELRTECVEGQCRGCNPDNNQGCRSTGPTPICNPETLVCRGCAGDDECPSVAPGTPEDADRDGDGPIAPASASDFCVDRQCRECNPDNHEGCVEAGDRPICRAGDCRVCERDADCDGRPGNRDECISDGAAVGQCKVCDPADNAGCDDPANPVCDPGSFTCGPCADNDECNRGLEAGAPPLECVGGLCSQCNPANNAGCDPLSEVPFCDGTEARNFCRACLTSAECVRLDTERGLDFEFAGCVAGRCTECDPQTQLGCPGTQVCDGGGSCRVCTVDADDPLNPTGDEECALGDGLRDQCVGGRCEVCDPVNFAGCGPRSATPVCDAETLTCVGCDRDRDCRAADGHPASPVGPECVDGFCRACDPTDGQGNAGCDGDGPLPYCDPALFGCAPCGTGVQGEDTRCADNPIAGLEQCIGDRCAQCDPNNHDGCGEADPRPICSAGTATCQGCGNDAECFLRPGNRDQCVGGACVVCDPADDAGCNDPNQPVCDDADRVCRACDVDAECPGALLCVGGRCVQCNPDDNRGCDVASAAPFCDPGNSTCRGCTLGEGDVAGGARDGECVGADLPQCVGGSCRECDPETHDGCDESSATPFCGANGVCRACGGNAECLLRPGSLDFCSAGGPCVECSQLDDAGCTGDQPICDDASETCRGCRNSPECGEGQTCLNRVCTGCDPNGHINCTPGSNASICDDPGFFCRACQGDGECLTNDADGDYCYLDRCVECDPEGDEQRGCEVDGDLPFCGADGRCRICRNDAECVIAPGDRDQCVSEQCVPCDTADNAGCDAASTNPLCIGANGNQRCRGCRNDGDCNGNPNGGQCLANGSCAVCDPVNDDGCVPGGTTPVCDAGSRTCVPCDDAGNDSDCAENDANGALCVGGACEECDPGTTEGCAEAGATPICDPSDKTCRACESDAECNLRPGDLDVCVGGVCKLCQPGTDLGCGGRTPICADGGDRCRACGDNAECGDGVQCLGNGSCAGCNPATNAGCDVNNPICETVGDQTQCRQCASDLECGGRYCVAGRCEACDPEGHAGCDGDELCCLTGNIYACGATGPDTQCTACGVACDVDGSNACTGRVCRCGGLNQCAGAQEYCLGDDPDGACSACRDNTDCVANGDTPICGGDVTGDDTNTCRGCANDNECIGHQRGAQCVGSGACQVCDPTDDAGCLPNSNRPICGGDFTCRGCQSDDECAENGNNGGQCVDNRCVQCDPEDHAGCVAASPTPICRANNVCGCDGDADCNGNPNGEQCVAGVCAECDPAAVNAGEANAGCVLGSDTPYCHPTNRTCIGCDNRDNRCQHNPNGTLCDGDTCVDCLTGTHDGCNADELCCDDGGSPACQGAAFGACTACQDGGCVDGKADACGERECLCGGGPACGGDLVCFGGLCVECANDDGCGGGEVCVQGACQQCEQGTNRGCTPAQPICNGADTCEACGVRGDGNAQCAADDDYGDFCLNGACTPCLPTGHVGCAADELCCNEGAQNGGIQCVPTNDDRCRACNFGDCDTEAGFFCDDNRTCVEAEGG